MNELSTFVLENDALSVRVSPVGAELQSVVCGGVERMWSGDPAVWGRRAPLLFPLIGRLRDGWYANGGRRVDAPMHGFCRDRLFAAEQESGARPFRDGVRQADPGGLSLRFPVDRRLLARGFLDRQVAHR
ncbi:MAG: hypothetical protein UCO86_13300 [Eggerthella lenta]|nr:hypothetical protein [Eggerthella lenta]